MHRSGPSEVAPEFLQCCVPVKLHFSIHDHGNETPLFKKLHYPLSLSRQPCPPRARFRVLFKAAQLVPFKLKVDFPQSGSAGPTDWKFLFAQRDNFGVFQHHLSPDQNESLF
jgi:hypothetical protein